MKKTKHLMLQLLLATALFIGVQSYANAQSPLKLGIGLEAGIPTGDVKDLYSVAAGISLNGKLALPLTGLEAIGSIGYQQWFWKGDYKDAAEASGGDLSDPGILPVKVGARYGFGALPIFVKFDLGPAFTVKKAVDGADGGTSFTYSPGVGVNLGPLEAELKYDAFSKDGGTSSFFGLKLSYYFN